MTAVSILNEGKSLSKVEQLSVGLALLRDGITDELFEQLRDQIDTAIAIERDQRVEDGLDNEIPLEEAIRNARESIA